MTPPAATPVPTRRPLPPGVVALDDYPPCVSPPGEPICVYAGRGENGTLKWNGTCIWMVREDNSTVRVVWPYGYSARLDPLIVYDNAGREVARSGDALRAGGNGPLFGAPDACGRTAYVVLMDGIERISP